jgi:hypothetical protein
MHSGRDAFRRGCIPRGGGHIIHMTHMTHMIHMTHMTHIYIKHIYDPYIYDDICILTLNRQIAGKP